MSEQSQIEAFVAALNVAHGPGYRPGYPHYVYSIDKPGPKFTRIVQSFNGEAKQRAVYCFIDNSNNDILKAAGWKAPAKGVRGNLATVDVSKCDPFGKWLYR